MLYCKRLCSNFGALPSIIRGYCPGHHNTAFTCNTVETEEVSELHEASSELLLIHVVLTGTGTSSWAPGCLKPHTACCHGSISIIVSCRIIESSACHLTLLALTSCKIKELILCTSRAEFYFLKQKHNHTCPPPLSLHLRFIPLLHLLSVIPTASSQLL